MRFSLAIIPIKYYDISKIVKNSIKYIHAQDFQYGLFDINVDNFNEIDQCVKSSFISIWKRILTHQLLYEISVNQSSDKNIQMLQSLLQRVYMISTVASFLDVMKIIKSGNENSINIPGNIQILRNNLRIKYYVQYPIKGNVNSFLHYQVYVYTKGFRPLAEYGDIDFYSFGASNYSIATNQQIDHYTIKALIKNPLYQIPSFPIYFRSQHQFYQYGSYEDYRFRDKLDYNIMP